MVLNLLMNNPAVRIIGPQFFPFMRVVKLVRSGLNITNSINPIMVVGNIILIVIDCYAPLFLRLAATCAASAAVAPKPISVGAAVYFANEIYDKG